VVHGAGLLLAVIGAFPLLHKARATSTTGQMMGIITYVASLVAFFASSTLQHSLHLTDASVVLRLIDHSAIYALIAGTYTPFLLSNMSASPPLSISLLAAVWALAIAGMTCSAVCCRSDIDSLPTRCLRTSLYAAMGWAGAIPCVLLWPCIEPAGWLLLLGGGVVFSTGVVLYLRRNRLDPHGASTGLHARVNCALPPPPRPFRSSPRLVVRVGATRVSDGVVACVSFPRLPCTRCHPLSLLHGKPRRCAAHWFAVYWYANEPSVQCRAAVGDVGALLTCPPGADSGVCAVASSSMQLNDTSLAPAGSAVGSTGVDARVLQADRPGGGGIGGGPGALPYTATTMAQLMAEAASTLAQAASMAAADSQRAIRQNALALLRQAVSTLEVDAHGS